MLVTHVVAEDVADLKHAAAPRVENRTAGDGHLERALVLSGRIVRMPHTHAH
jgi:hypothetical protein